MLKNPRFSGLHRCIQNMKLPYKIWIPVGIEWRTIFYVLLIGINRNLLAWAVSKLDLN